MHNRNCFFTNGTKSPFFSQQKIGRLAFYPMSVLMGHATFSLVGQSMILAAAPPLMHLIILATISAFLLMPIFDGIKFLIDKNLSASSYQRTASYALLYLVDIFVNLKLIAFLAVILYRPIMNIYALYAIVGAGIFPVVALSIVAALAIQSYYSSQNNRIYQELSSINDDINDDINHDANHTFQGLNSI